MCVPFARQIFGRDRGSCNILRWERNDVLVWKSGTLVPFSDDAVAAADRQDCEDKRQCKREVRSHLAGPPMLRGEAEGQ